MKMVAIMLLRHAAHDDLGRVLSGRTPVPLNEQGRRQAQRVAERLLDRLPKAIHSSPQLRARQTTQIIASHLGMEVEIMKALDEIDFGDWTGASFETLSREPLWQRWNERRSISAPPGGESMAAAIERSIGYLEEIRADSDDCILCVSHGDIIRGTLAHYLGLPLDDIFSFEIEPASLSTVELTHRATRVVLINEAAA